MEDIISFPQPENGPKTSPGHCRCRCFIFFSHNTEKGYCFFPCRNGMHVIFSGKTCLMIIFSCYSLRVQASMPSVGPRWTPSGDAAWPSPVNEITLGVTRNVHLLELASFSPAFREKLTSKGASLRAFTDGGAPAKSRILLKFFNFSHHFFSPVKFYFVCHQN